MMDIRPFAHIAFVCAGLLSPAAAAADSLSAAPPRGAASVPLGPPALDSVVTLTAFMSYAALQQIGEAKIPPSIPVSGSGKAGCVDLLGKKICADYRWNADIHKDGPLAIGPGDAGTRVRLPLRIIGKAGLQGELANLIKLDPRTFDVTATPAADLTVALDPQWRPVVTASTLGNWVSDAKVQMMGRECAKIDLGFVRKSACVDAVHVELAKILNDVIERRHGDIERAIAAAIPADRIRARIADAWRPISLKAPGAGGLYLDIAPKSAAASKLTPTPDGVKLTVRLGALASLAAGPLPGDPLPLPTLEKADPGDARLQASLTIVSPYEVLKTELAAKLVDKDFVQATPFGEVRIHIDDIDVYPSGAALAIGLKISAKAPTSLLDTSGWVYLTGRPIVSDTGRGLRIIDLKYAAVLDSSFWQVAQSALEGTVLSELKARSEIDLSARLDEVSNRIADALAKANLRGVRLTASPPKIALAAVTIAPAGLAASAIVAMTLDVELTSELVGP
jgi:hypothetical protein